MCDACEAICIRPLYRRSVKRFCIAGSESKQFYAAEQALA
jgi:hypothetical protein